jgi:hypothetical protein
MKKSIALSACAGILFFAVFCENTTTPTPSGSTRGEATILSPTDNQEYNLHNIVELILEYDSTKWNSLIDWQFSKDSGKSWNDITFAPGQDKKFSLPKSNDGLFHYVVQRWIPEQDSLTDDADIWIKASAYGGDVTSVIKKNIKIRKPT